MSLLPWTHPVTDFGHGQRQFREIATPEQCAAVAADLGLLACAMLTAAYTVRPLGGGRYSVDGTVDALVTQACVVTLEPVESRLQLPLVVEFAPEAPEAAVGRQREDDPEADSEVLALPDIERLEHGQLDIGRVVFEIVAAGLDPYPKKPDAEFGWRDPKDDGAPPNPFAVLANLKPKP